MKAKLVKYPFNKKKYRWDTYKQGKEFEYTWSQGAIKTYDYLRPYAVQSPINYNLDYGVEDRRATTADLGFTISATPNGPYIYPRQMPDGALTLHERSTLERCRFWFPINGTYIDDGISYIATNTHNQIYYTT
jgi:hypothetical protein